MNKFFLAALLLGVSVSVSANTIASQTAGGSSFNGISYGESVTTPGNGPWDTIGFNFINGNDGTAYAIGGLYVLTQPYSGTAANLSSSTPGYLGFTNTINNGIWNFSGLTLNPNAQYFFLMDSIVPLGQVIRLTSSGDAFPGGAIYVTGGGPNTYTTVAGADMLFVLTGNQVSGTPEPGSRALLMVGAAAMMAALRRRRV